MKNMLRQGGWSAVVIAAALVLVPPLFAENLEGWEAAKRLLPAEPALVGQCGTDARIVLSKWFYTYKVSGDNAQAKFRGRVRGPTCDRSFSVELKGDAGDWKVTQLLF